MIDKLSDLHIRHALILIWLIAPLAFVLGRVAWDVLLAIMVIHILTGR